MGPANFWLFMAGIAGTGALVMILGHRWWVRQFGLVEEKMEEADEALFA